MEDEFGSQAPVILRDLALLEFSDQTPKVLLDSGQDPGEVWLAVCRSLAVPKERWTGLDKKAKKRHAGQ